jgi:hypothetical protein
LLAVAGALPRDRCEVVLTDENIEAIDFGLQARRYAERCSEPTPQRCRKADSTLCDLQWVEFLTH